VTDPYTVINNDTHVAIHLPLTYLITQRRIMSQKAILLSEAHHANANFVINNAGMVHLLLQFVQDFALNPVKLGR
jgi:hypothetical protein